MRASFSITAEHSRMVMIHRDGFISSTILQSEGETGSGLACNLFIFSYVRIRVCHWNVYVALWRPRCHWCVHHNKTDHFGSSYKDHFVKLARQLVFSTRLLLPCLKYFIFSQIWRISYKMVTGCVSKDSTRFIWKVPGFKALEFETRTF